MAGLPTEKFTGKWNPPPPSFANNHDPAAGCTLKFPPIDRSDRRKYNAFRPLPPAHVFFYTFKRKREQSSSKYTRSSTTGSSTVTPSKQTFAKVFSIRADVSRHDIDVSRPRVLEFPKYTCRKRQKKEKKQITRLFIRIDALKENNRTIEIGSEKLVQFIRFRISIIFFSKHREETGRKKK